MNKYAIALAEISIPDLEKFDVFTLPRKDMVTIPTAWSDPVTDKSGQSEPIPTHWANGWIVEMKDWKQEDTDIIESGRKAFNAKYPNNPIPAEQDLIWEGGDFVQYFDPITDLYRRTGDFVIVPSSVYLMNVEDLVRGLGIDDSEDNLIADYFIWLNTDGSNYYPTLKEFNENAVETKSGWIKQKGIKSLFVNNNDVNQEFYVIEIKPLTDDLGERELIYRLALNTDGTARDRPNFTICRTADRVLEFVKPKPIS